MKYTKTCECCGHRITAYSHKLNLPLLSALGQLIDFYGKTGRRASLQQDLALTKNQYNNFQKLQYFGLVHRDNDGWLPTQKAQDFFNGDILISDTAATLGREILPADHPAWETHKARIKTLDIYNFFPDLRYKQESEYKEEKTMSLFDLSIT